MGGLDKSMHAQLIRLSTARSVAPELHQQCHGPTRRKLPAGCGQEACWTIAGKDAGNFEVETLHVS